ncbi:MAG: hypothetical protein WBC91_01025 [Phototrophicaceae bacterium]
MDNHVEKLEHNLALLKGYGIHYIDIVRGSLFAIQKIYNGEVEADSEQLARFFEMCEAALDEHKILLKMSDEDRLNYPND